MSEVNRNGEILRPPRTNDEMLRALVGNEQRRTTAELSSSQRSEQMDRTVKQVQALSEESDKHAAGLRGLSRSRTDLMTQLFSYGVLRYNVSTDAWESPLAERLVENEVIARAARNRIIAFEGMTFWRRLRWLLIGR